MAGQGGFGVVLKLHEVGIPPEDAQFIETRKFQIQEIARVFRIPPHMLADLDRATFSNDVYPGPGEEGGARPGVPEHIQEAASEPVDAAGNAVDADGKVGGMRGSFQR